MRCHEHGLYANSNRNSEAVGKRPDGDSAAGAGGASTSLHLLDAKPLEFLDSSSFCCRYRWPLGCPLGFSLSVAKLLRFGFFGVSS